MSCLCQICGRKYKVDILVENQLWEKIRRNRDMLCGVCIARQIEKLDKYAAFDLKTISIEGEKT